MSRLIELVSILVLSLSLMACTLFPSRTQVAKVLGGETALRVQVALSKYRDLQPPEETEKAFFEVFSFFPFSEIEQAIGLLRNDGVCYDDAGEEVLCEPKIIRLAAGLVGCHVGSQWKAGVDDSDIRLLAKFALPEAVAGLLFYLTDEVGEPANLREVLAKTFQALEANSANCYDAAVATLQEGPVFENFCVRDVSSTLMAKIADHDWAALVPIR